MKYVMAIVAAASICAAVPASAEEVGVGVGVGPAGAGVTVGSDRRDIDRDRDRERTTVIKEHEPRDRETTVIKEREREPDRKVIIDKNFSRHSISKLHYGLSSPRAGAVSFLGSESMPRDPFIREKFTRERTAARSWPRSISSASQKSGTRPRSRAGASCSRRISNLR